MSILVVGSVALDSVKTPFGQGGNLLGGSATYFAIAASFFSKVNLVAVVGEDFPEEHLDFLKQKGIDLEGLQIAKGRTFRWKGEYGYDLNVVNTIYTHLNVFSHFTPSIPQRYKRSPYVFLANIDPVLQLKVLDQLHNPKLVACDTMDYWIENKRGKLLKLLKQVDLLVVNQSEARELSGQSNLLKAVRKLVSFGPKSVIIKKGEHGAILFSQKTILSLPAYLLESIYDPTGAGDTFAGGLIGYLAKSKNATSSQGLKNAMVYGSIMASYVVEDFSLNRLRRLTKRDIEKRSKQFRKLIQL